nr:hypothetical protein [Microbacterium bovistercoris]
MAGHGSRPDEPFDDTVPVRRRTAPETDPDDLDETRRGSPRRSGRTATGEDAATGGDGPARRRSTWTDDELDEELADTGSLWSTGAGDDDTVITDRRGASVLPDDADDDTMVVRRRSRRDTGAPDGPASRPPSLDEPDDRTRATDRPRRGRTDRGQTGRGQTGRGQTGGEHAGHEHADPGHALPTSDPIATGEVTDETFVVHRRRPAPASTPLPPAGARTAQRGAPEKAIYRPRPPEPARVDRAPPQPVRSVLPGPDAEPARSAATRRSRLRTIVVLGAVVVVLVAALTVALVVLIGSLPTS